jgi:predicted lipid-binding transport protein (Tim44 family)
MIIDIIIFAAIAAFFAWKLRQVLGHKTGDEQERGNPFAPRPDAQSDKVIDGEATEVRAAPAIMQAAPNSLADALQQVRVLDSSFDEKHFLVGARAAFTMIVEAFAAGDESQLKNLLRPTVFAGFMAEIERRTTAGETMVTKVQRVLAADISAARVEGKTAALTVDFTSEQLSYTTNAAGEVIDGDAKKAHVVAESWTFERDTSNTDPNWFLVATRAR